MSHFLKINQFLLTPSRIGPLFWFILLGGGVALLIAGCMEAQPSIASMTPVGETSTVELGLITQTTPDPEGLLLKTTTPTPETPVEARVTAAVPQSPSSFSMETPTSPAAIVVSPTVIADSSEQVVGMAGYALRFFSTGKDDLDRVKIRLDDPATIEPGPPADIGATDFTLEWWLRAELTDNQSPPVECGPDNVNWIYGNIIIDRDRYNQDRKFGVSLAAGRLVFGISGDGTGDFTFCGTSKIADGQWHHVAIQRRRVDGYVWLFVDGRLEAEGVGPGGDVSYPDDGYPGDFCGGPCVNSDPFLVIGAEKHDAGPEYPSFSGWLDEVRLSTSLRYQGNFARPTAPFQSDADTAALWHFDEGRGDMVYDSAPGGFSPGRLHVGGPQQGPRWVVSDAPFQ